MKKLLSVLLISLVPIQYINTNTYANCDMSYIDEEQIDFSKLIKKGARSITQTVDDKKIKVTSYEQISRVKIDLEKEIADALKKLVKNHNSNIDANVFIHIFDKAMDLLIHTAKTGANALNQIEKMIDDETLNKLNEKEQEEAAVEGRDSAIIPTLGATALGATLGALSKSGISKIVGSKAIQLLLAKAGLGSLGGPVTAMVVIAGSTIASVGAFFGFSSLYNKFHVEPITQKLENLLWAFQHVYCLVRDDIINHRWMDGNVLITAVPLDSSCTEGYARFHNVDGIRYSKSQKAINWEFAKAECKFLNADHDDCYQKAKETIECLWDNLDDPSKCESNPYYYGNAEKYEL